MTMLSFSRKGDLIFVEAKAYGRWDNDQLQSKLDRLELLRDEHEQITAQDSSTQVQMHFMLISPPKSKAEKVKINWRSWKEPMSPIPWIELKLSRTESILEVNLCDEYSKRSANGNYWRIVEHGAQRARSSGR